ncbi:hypothetical protein FA15DRAFT_649920 [Coprinopsis marcescibilis]|uniref:Mannose-P-dolichol utilization defect 1 protein homolog n=1 Tax=Coprinopsis marcescibilis TaxID=230819 RepID=A0A5C3KDU6_COPMA|nr:hypothetical protein FA15DRAFT_649920 [Coprinopsis marcescibilis]
MTAITRNLPWFIKDLGVGIIGQKCYTTLIEDLNITDVPCLKHGVSKGLGIGIVVGGSIMKVPQILLIVNAKSARGLSLPSYVLETLSYGITLAYSVRNHFPFSTYGENLFLSLQNILITLLIIAYTPRSAFKYQKITLTAISTVATSYALSIVPLSTLTLLQLSTLPLSLLSKFPQIRQNARSQSTGQLSAFAVISQIAGCLARLFTTAQEVKDPVVAAGFFLALLLNLVLGYQLWAYWGQGEKPLTNTHSVPTNAYELGDLNGRGLGGGIASTTAKATTSSDIRERRASPPSFDAPAAPVPKRVASPIGIGRVGTPPLRQGTPNSAGARKWSRKVD